MDDLETYNSSQKAQSFTVFLLGNFIVVSSFIVLREIFEATLPVALGITIAATAIISYGGSYLLTSFAQTLLRAVFKDRFKSKDQTNQVVAVQDSETNTQSEIDVAYKALQATVKPVDNYVKQDYVPLSVHKNMLDELPLPILGLDANQKIVTVNVAAEDYLQQSTENMLGRSVFEVMQLSFQGSDTLENWLSKSNQTVATSTNSWTRVRMQLPDEKGQKQFDLIAHFSKGASNGHETILAVFDHTEQYDAEDNSTAYVALAVHELRTPLTLLRGYIEVFEEELDKDLTPELRDFMHKMSASAQTLTAFVSNILNVARVDENSLTLTLREANWNELLPSICSDLELRAKVRKKDLVFDIAPNLPTVAVDKVSIYEVMSNLIENAIKYSGDSKRIVIHSKVGSDGTIETSVEDFGLGVSSGALKHLFTKFYRSHRSKGMVSGSGLGLYLVKAIVTAHGGNVWVKSKEGQGSTFGFTIQPYARVATETNDPNSGTIDREAHGWIKNHSMYRR